MMHKPIPLSEHDFFEHLKTKVVDDKDNLNKLLKEAYRIRDFELDLYWKRATYFWAFIFAAFSAFVYLKTLTKPNNKLEFCVLCVGFIFSLAWYLVNRGSTYWTTNWERIIDTIESRIGRQLYKLNLMNDKRFFYLFGHYSYSVSKINIIVSLFICFIWFVFLLDTTYVLFNNNLDYKILLLGIITFLTSLYMVFCTHSSSGYKDGEDGKGSYSFYLRGAKYKTMSNSNMTIEQKFDKIIDILYDENLLHWKEVPATDFVAFAKNKLGIGWSDAEINLILTILQNDGFVILNKNHSDNSKLPTFSLTAKGVQMKRKGGFTKTKFIENFKNKIILWGSLFAFIVGGFTIYDIVNKTWFSSVPSISNKPNYETQTNNSQPHSDSLNQVSNNIHVINSDSVFNSINK